MFSKRLISSVINSRFISHTLVRPRRGPNPGFNRHLKEVDDETAEKISEDPEAFGEMESDFMNVHRSHKDHMAEMQAYKDFVRLKIVKNKYFKEKYPNFLTFSEKEQIRLLHSRDPSEWTVEKLAESFPADEEIIMKILKARWYPQTEKRLYKHEQKVLENWEKFRAGEHMDLPPGLKDHLKKFATRKLSDLVNIEAKWLPKRPELPVPKTNEFSSIITSCSAYQQRKQLAESTENSKLITASKNEITVNKFRSVSEPREEETLIAGEIVNKKPITLDELKRRAGMNTSREMEMIPSKAVSWHDIIEDEKKDYKNDLELNSVQKYDFHEVAISDNDVKKYDIAPIKERISIPKKIRKRGHTYRVDDCYYDDDGLLLYRVPGMTGKTNKNNDS